MGRTNAAVLPLPVIAHARRSRPSIAGGMESFWMGVGFVKPISLMPRRRSGWRRNEEKGMREESLSGAAPRLTHVRPVGFPAGRERWIAGGAIARTGAVDS